jgi:hypothetical protein
MRARDDMFKATDTPWRGPIGRQEADALSAITQILSPIPYDELPREGEAAGPAEGARLHGAGLPV